MLGITKIKIVSLKKCLRRKNEYSKMHINQISQLQQQGRLSCVCCQSYCEQKFIHISQLSFLPNKNFHFSYLLSFRTRIKKFVIDSISQQNTNVLTGSDDFFNLFSDLFKGCMQIGNQFCYTQYFSFLCPLRRSGISAKSVSTSVSCIRC